MASKMTQEDLVKTLEFAAHRCFLGDGARDPKHGGGLLADVVGVRAEYDDTAEEHRVYVKTADGRIAHAAINGALVPRELGRELRPGDLHDAVYEALLRANQGLPAATAATSAGAP